MYSIPATFHVPTQPLPALTDRQIAWCARRRDHTFATLQLAAMYSFDAAPMERYMTMINEIEALRFDPKSVAFTVNTMAADRWADQLLEHVQRVIRASRRAE